MYFNHNYIKVLGQYLETKYDLHNQKCVFHFVEWEVIVNGGKASFFFYSRLNRHQSNMKHKHITKRKSIEIAPKYCSLQSPLVTLLRTWPATKSPVLQITFEQKIEQRSCSLGSMSRDDYRLNLLADCCV